jgi:hypothetical protein
MKGNTVSLTGDWSNTTTLEVFAPVAISQVRFNGDSLHVSKTTYGSLVGTLSRCSEDAASVLAKLPSLATWKVADGLPERAADYDDSKWIGSHFLHSFPHQDQMIILSYSRESHQYTQSNKACHVPSFVWR